MNILSIDTATEIFGLGLLTGHGQWFDIIKSIGLKHAEIVMGAVDRVLGEANLTVSDLDLVVCAKGPGSFTGLRIGMATAKGLAAGAGKPLKSVPTLDAMAYDLDWFPGKVVPVIDAKKKRVYTAVYQSGRRITGFLDTDLVGLTALLRDEESILFTGPGAHLAGNTSAGGERVCEDRRGAFGWNRAYTELGLASFREEGPDALDSGPEYLRKSDAEIHLDERRTTRSG